MVCCEQLVLCLGQWYNGCFPKFPNSFVMVECDRFVISGRLEGAVDKIGWAYHPWFGCDP